MLRILIGYVLSLLYVMALILLLAPMVRKKAGIETSRKIVHTMLFFVWVLIDIFFKATVHQIIIPVIFIVLNALSYKFKLFKSIEREEDNPPGTIYFAIAITFTLSLAYFLPDWYYPSGVAAFCLTLGDGAASLAGCAFSSKHLRRHKTLAGSIACIALSFVSLCVFYLIYLSELPLPSIVAIAVFAGIMELTENGLDNFSVVGGSFVLSYVLMYYSSAELILAIFIAEAVFATVFVAGAIDYRGSLLALLMVFSYSYFGGGFALLYLLAMYFTIFFISRFKTRFLNFPKNSDSRGVIQIAINGGFALLLIFAYAVTGHEKLLTVAFISVGACFVDSVSSDIGTLSKTQPYDILRFKRVPTGLSGGVSLLGTLSAALATLALTLSIGLYMKHSAGEMLTVFLLIFSQTLIDSILGSAFQIKYRCEICGELTDRAVHCNTRAVPVRGKRLISNNAVNLISSAIVTMLAYIVFML